MAHSGGRGWFHRKRANAETPLQPDASITETESNSESVTSSLSNPSSMELAHSPVVTGGSDVPGMPGSSDRPAEGSDRSETGSAVSEPPSLEGAAAQPNEGPRPTGTKPIDWDAETAAALRDIDGASAPHAWDRPSTSPDELLENIIREIVGDAAVDTVSTLQQPGTVVGALRDDTEATVVPRPAGVAEPASGHDEPMGGSSGSKELPSSSSTEAAGTEAHATEGPETAATPEPTAIGLRLEEAAALSSAMEARQASESEALADGRTEAAFSAVPSQPVAEATDVESGAAAHTTPLATNVLHAEQTTAEATSTPPTADVSRETSFMTGGTPLADQLADETRRRIALDEAVLPLPESTRVLTISNQKGGVGKTTTAVNLAAALARSGAKVLVIDLDPQGNASTALGVDHRSEQRSVYEVLVSDMTLAEVIRPSSEHELLDCVPATIHLAGAEIELVSLVAREQRLRRALDAHLKGMDRPYDYVFIDCPPSLGLLTINAFVAAREVLIPIQCEYYALEGLSQLLSNIELIEKHLNPDLRLSTILLTMYDSRTNLAQQVAQEVRDHFPAQTLGTIIPRSVRVSEAPSYGQSVISYDFASSGSLSYREAAAEIARRGATTAGVSAGASNLEEQH